MFILLYLYIYIYIYYLFFLSLSLSIYIYKDSLKLFLHTFNILYPPTPQGTTGCESVLRTPLVPTYWEYARNHWAGIIKGRNCDLDLGSPPALTGSGNGP